MDLRKCGCLVGSYLFVQYALVPMHLNIKKYSFDTTHQFSRDFDRQRLLFFEIVHFLERLSPSSVVGWDGKSLEKCDACHIEFQNEEYDIQWVYGRIRLDMPDEFYPLFLLQFGEHTWTTI